MRTEYGFLVLIICPEGTEPLSEDQVDTIKRGLDQVVYDLTPYRVEGLVTSLGKKEKEP